MNKDKMKKDCLVFAHVKGYFPWPSRVLEVKGGSVKVQFFKTNEVNSVNIKKWTSPVNAATLKSNAQKFGNRIGYQEALEEMEKFANSLSQQSTLPNEPNAPEKLATTAVSPVLAVLISNQCVMSTPVILKQDELLEESSFSSQYVVPESIEPEIRSRFASGGRNPMTPVDQAIGSRQPLSEETFLPRSSSTPGIQDFGKARQNVSDGVSDGFSETGGQQGIHGLTSMTGDQSINPPSPCKEDCPTDKPDKQTINPDKQTINPDQQTLIHEPKVTDLSLHTAGPSGSGTTFRCTTKDSYSTSPNLMNSSYFNDIIGVSTESIIFAKPNNSTAVSIKKDPSSLKPKPGSSVSLKRKQSVLQDLNTSMAVDLDLPKKIPKVENNIKKEKKEKKLKKEIKRPSNAFILYFNDNQIRIKQENPKLVYKEISKIAAAEWDTLKKDNAEKFLEYQNRYKESMDLYKKVKDAAKENIIENDMYYQEIQDLKKENMQLKDENEKVVKENLDLKSQNIEYKQNINRLENENSTLEKEKNSLVTAYNQSKDVVDKLLKNQ